MQILNISLAVLVSLLHKVYLKRDYPHSKLSSYDPIHLVVGTIIVGQEKNIMLAINRLCTSS